MMISTLSIAVFLFFFINRRAGIKGAGGGGGVTALI